MSVASFIEPYQLFRLLKLLSFAVLAGGVAATLAAPTRRGRLLMTYGYVVPGFVATWTFGWMLLALSRRSLTEPWLLVALLASVASLHLTFLYGHLERPRAISARLAVGTLAAAAALMVVRTRDPLLIIFWTLVPTALGALITRPSAVAVSALDADDLRLVVRSFRLAAWAEGGSLLFMLLVSMPAKYLLGYALDAGTGLIGWVHGVFVVVYLQSLSSTSRLLGWPRSTWLLGFAAAFIPGAPFVFERRYVERETK